MKYYVEGDSISVDYCGEDLSASTTGKVVYADKEHLIVRFEFCNPFAADGLNRKGLSEDDISQLNGIDIESFRKNEYDVFIDLKSPHTYLPNDIFGDFKAAIRPEDIYWNNIVLDEPINNYIVVEKDGKYNFIDVNNDDYISDLWFDRVINWTSQKYTIVQLEDTCYLISLGKGFNEEDYLYVTHLTPTPMSSRPKPHPHPKLQNRKPQRHFGGFKEIFRVNELTVKDIVYKTVCKIEDRWYLTHSLREPWARRWRDIYYKRDREATVKMDRQWWYFMFTTFACAELSIGQANGKYGFFPLMSHMGMQDAEYYAKDYPFIYDEYKIYESDTVRQHTHIDNAYSYIAVREDDKWGLLKITGMPTMTLERVAESKYLDPDTMFSELGIEVPEIQDEPALREETDE